MDDAMKVLQSIYQFLTAGQTKERRKAMLFWSAAFSAITLVFRLGAALFAGSRPDWMQWPARCLRGFLLAVALCLLCELLRCAAGRFLTQKKCNVWWVGAALTLVFLLPALFGSGSLAQVSSVQEGISQLFRTWLPALFSSAVLTVLALQGGLYPAILFALLTQALPQLSPLELNASRMTVLLDCLLPVLFLIALDFELTPEKPEKEEKKKKPRTVIAANVAFVLLLVVVLLFSWGLLPLRPTAVATGSMEPKLDIGDLVVISTWDSEIEVGDIIQFNRDGLTVIHRVVEIAEEDGETVYLTRGDANNNVDDGFVRPADIEGRVLFSIPYLGWITLWMHTPG